MGGWADEAARPQRTPLTTTPLLFPPTPPPTPRLTTPPSPLSPHTKAPDEELLDRRPYKRNTSLISRPMWRNILVQSAYQITVLLLLLLR